MFFPLRLKIISLITGIMVVTAGTIIFFTNQDISRDMLAQQEMLSKNVLYLINLNIKGSYDNLVADKINSVRHYKDILKSRTDLALNMIQQQVHYIDKKQLSPEDAKHIIMKWVRESGSSKLGEMFIIKDYKILAHSPSDTLKQGMDISEFRDMKNKSISETVTSWFFGSKPIINVFNWDAENGSDTPGTSKQLTCLREYKRWNWIIGAIINIDDLETEAENKLDNISEILKETFSEIKIAETGFAFLFDQERNILAMTDDGMKEAFSSATNTHTGNILLQDMIHTVQENPEGSLLYTADFNKNNGEMLTYISFFKPLGWYVGVSVPVAEIKRPAKKMVSKQSTLISIILLSSIIIAAWFISRISKPLNTLSNHAKALSTIDFTKDELKNDFIERLTHKNDEVGRLARSFSFMEKELRHNIRELVETTAVNERIEGELGIAKEIQLGILPKTFPPFPEEEKLDIYASIEPAKEVGGDLYDFYYIDQDKFCFAIGDVSDKGVPAALMMVITKTLIKASAAQNISPARVMVEVNNAIAGDNPRTMFVTLLIGVLDLKTGRVTYSNGGHNPPVLIKNNGQSQYLKKISGPVVGAMEKIPYKELAIDLNKGDALFMYTDGVTEAMNPEKQFYTDKRLMDKLGQMKGASAEKTIRYIKNDIKSFVGKAPQYDDIAMLMVKYT